MSLGSGIVLLAIAAGVFGMATVATAADGASTPGVRIARYLGDRQGAVSLTFDDGFKHQVENAVEILNATGLRGTFFLIPRVMVDGHPRRTSHVSWKRVKELIKQGHEMGTHDLTKPRLNDEDDKTLDERINGSWELIKKHTGVAPVSFAMPGGTREEKRISLKVMERHQIFRQRGGPGPMVVAGYGSVGRRVWTDPKARQRIEQAKAKGEWVVAVIHAIIKGYSPFKSKAEFRGHCEWLKSQADTIWTAPMGEVALYVKARDAAKLTTEQTKPREVTFTLTCDLKPAETFKDVALTVVIDAPGATKATAVQGKTALTAKAANGRILIDVKPNTGAVKVTW